jgi:hypothetical protein
MSYAFNSHCPLVLTPDSVWLTILTGLTHHIDTDPEGLRHHFVKHEGKKELEVVVMSPSIFQASADVWEQGIQGGPLLETPSFVEQLQEHIGKRHDLIVCNFSTTTDTDRLSSQVALMGAMKHWFEYKMMLLCDLTRVTIEGTPEDWGDIIDRARVLSEFGLGWWTDHLIPVLDQLRLACEGKPDIDFWKAAYLKHSLGSGGEYLVSGWINALYPYVAGSGDVKGMMANKFVDWQKDHGGRYPGLDPDDFPLGLISTPVKVDDHGQPHVCEFYGGLVGVSMAEDFAVQPQSGFAMQWIREGE